MEANTFWQLFLETGAPEMYLLYNRVRNVGDGNVFDDSGTCATSHNIQ